MVGSNGKGQCTVELVTVLLVLFFFFYFSFDMTETVKKTQKLNRFNVEEIVP